MVSLRKLRLAALCLTAIGSLMTLKAHASAPQFPTLTQGEFDSIIKEMSANGVLHSVTPPSSYGSIFGFELGVVGGATRTPDIESIVKQASPSTESKYLPHVGLLGAVTVPFGLTGELLVTPQLDVSGVKFQQYAVALKWTPTDNVLSIVPANIAIRGFYSKTDLSFDQTLSGVTANVNYNGSVTGLHVFASPKFIPVLEPYLGLGVLSSTGKMSASAGTLFDFTSNQEAESSPTSSHLILGLDIRLLLIGFGFEYNRAFGADSYTGKLSLKF